MDMADRRSNSSDGSFDLVGTSNSDQGLSYVSTGRSKKKDKKKKSKKGKTEEINAYDYGSQYVLPPPPPPEPMKEEDPLVPSNNLDPDDPLANDNNGYREAFEDEMEDEEMREEMNRNFHDFSDTEKRPLRGRTFRTLTYYGVPILVALFFFLGIVAAILYLMGVGKTVAKVEQEVPTPPDNLSLMCYDSNPSLAANVPSLCEDYCKASQCCWDPEGKFACGEGTEVHCPDYVRECGPWKDQLLGVKSSNLESGVDGSTSNSDKEPREVFVPPMRAGLHTACERTFTDEVSNECKAGCAAADCCWNVKTTTICTADTVENCVDYKDACSFLNGELEDANAGAGGDVSDVDPGTLPFPEAPEGLSIYCDPSEMEEISLHICEDKCGEAECCWKTGVESCITKYPQQACRDYTQACAVLNNLATAPDGTHDVTSETSPAATAESNSDTLQEAPSDLDDICSKDRIADPADGGKALIECERECLNASCCWQPNAASPCSGDSKCAGYKACDLFATLFEKPEDYESNEETLKPLTHGTVPEAADDINEVCNPDYLTTKVNGGKSIVECEKSCLVGACCWKKNHPSHCPDAAECSAYMTPCGTNLVNALVALENTTPAPHTTRPPSSQAPAPTAPAPAPTSTTIIESNVPPAPGNIDLFCNPDVLKLTVDDGDYIIECEKICLAAACCWKENHATTCPDAPECDQYIVPCKDNLVPALQALEGENTGSGSTPSTPSTPANPDTPAPAATGSTPAPAPSIPVAPDDISVTCSVENLNSDPLGREQCEDACSLAECCWKIEDVSDCSSNILCEEYGPCENLLTTTTDAGGAISVTPPAPPENLQDTCKRESILDLNGMEACRVMCEAAACCWTDDSDPGSCKTSVECRTYENECELMRDMLELQQSMSAGGSSNTNSDPTENIESVCDTSTAFYLRSRCEDVCRPGQCCFLGGSCDPGIDCLDYSPCNVLSGSGRRMLRRNGFLWPARV